MRLLLLKEKLNDCKENIIGIFMVTCGWVLSRVLSDKLKGRLLCKFLRMHKEPRQLKSDGASLFGVCPSCGKQVSLDSHGYWESEE